MWFGAHEHSIQSHSKNTPNLIACPGHVITSSYPPTCSVVSTSGTADSTWSGVYFDSGLDSANSGYDHRWDLRLLLQPLQQETELRCGFKCTQLAG